MYSWACYHFPMAESTTNTDRRSLFLAWLLVGAVIILSAPLSVVVFTTDWSSAADRRLALAVQTTLLAALAGAGYLGLRRLLGAPMALTAVASFVPTVLFAQLAGAMGVASSFSRSPALLFAAAGLGAAFGLSWGHWSGRQLRTALFGAALAMAAAAGISWLNRSLCAPDCVLPRQGIAALNGGLLGLALALGVAPAILGLGPPEIARISEAYRRIQANLRPWHRWAAPVAVALIALNLALAVLSQGLQLCGWLDSALSRSGCYRSFDEPRSVKELGLSPDGRLLAYTYYDHPDRAGVLVRWIADGAVVYDLRSDAWFANLRFSPDGGLLAVAELVDGKVTVWSLSDGQLRYTLPDQATVIAFSPDGSELLTLTARYRAADGTLLGRLPEAEAGENSIAADGFGVFEARSFDRSLLADIEPDYALETAEASGRIELRDTTGALLRTLQGAPGERFTYLWFSPDNTMLAAGVELAANPIPLNAELHIFRLSDGALLKRFASAEGFELAAWSADSRTLAAWEDRRGALFFRVVP